jgi:tetraacyldisaccharide 4'-kinase
VVSIGGISAGGAGKTPLTIALARALGERGLHVDVLSRGYGRRSKRTERVDADGAADEFGDEPILIARETGVPVYVARQRFEAGQLAEAAQIDSTLPGIHLRAVHLLDDGFQHRQLHRDVDILLLDGRDWHEGGLLPAGNLREPIEAARRATVIAIPDGERGRELEERLRAWGWEGPVWRLRRKMVVLVADGAVMAFCGIARPEQFFAGLDAAGVRMAGRYAFRDHHEYTHADLERLVTAAEKSHADAFVTTEKDLVRLGKMASALRNRLPLTTAGLRIEIENEDEVIEWLTARMADACRG